MKYSVLSLAITLLSLTSSNGFVVPASTTFVPGTSTRLFGGVALEPEPEGGEELDAIVSMTNTRMKNMGQSEKGGESEDGQPIYTFWLTSEADGSFIKEIRTKVMKDAAKNANFPGFRKGQIPPYAQPQMTMFAIQECIIKTCESAVDAYGLKSLPGSDGSVEVHEDVKDMSNGYKQGSSLQFTATFQATFDPEKQKKEEDAAPSEDETVATE